MDEFPDKFQFVDELSGDTQQTALVWQFPWGVAVSVGVALCRVDGTSVGDGIAVWGWHFLWGWHIPGVFDLGPYLVDGRQGVASMGGGVS